METLAVIIPVYGEKELVYILYNRLTAVLRTLPVNYKIIYVNDNCPFGSGYELEKIAENDNNVTLINFSRNFGEAYAVKAGIDNCEADYAIVMDCDLQDLPEDIPALFNKAKEGFDVVWGERAERKDNFIKKLYSNSFYALTNMISETKIDKKIGSFSIISKKIINELKKMDDYSFHYIQMVEYLGFKKAYIQTTKAERPIGKTCYNFAKGLKLATNIIISTSTKPLLLPIYTSFILFILLVIGLIVNTIVDTSKISFSSFDFLLLIIFLFVTLFFNIGIVSIYIGMILKETLSKPHYVIKDKRN